MFRILVAAQAKSKSQLVVEFWCKYWAECPTCSCSLINNCWANGISHLVWKLETLRFPNSNLFLQSSLIQSNLSGAANCLLRGRQGERTYKVEKELIPQCSPSSCLHGLVQRALDFVRTSKWNSCECWGNAVIMGLRKITSWGVWWKPNKGIR